MWNIARNSLLTVVILLAGNSIAEEESRNAFDDAYEEYQRHLASGDNERALQAAKLASESGSIVFGKKSVNAANLALNYAHLLNQIEQHDTARLVLKDKLKVLQKRYGSTAPELLPMYMELGHAHFQLDRPKKGIGYFRRAAKLVANDKNALYRARINFDIASHLVQRRGELVANEFVESALAIYKRHLKKDDLRLGTTAFLSGKFLISDQQFERAKQELALAIEVFSSGTDNSITLDARKSMVAALENLGQPNAATEHCLAIGRAQQDQHTFYLPIYTVQPDYPRRALQRRLTGEVELTFTVNADGVVVEPKILASASEVFNQSALNTIRKFRYAPKFQHGAAVTTTDVRYKLYFGGPQGVP